jgi:hypothetical protein
MFFEKFKNLPFKQPVFFAGSFTKTAGSLMLLKNP